MFNVEELRKKLVSLDIETSGLQDDARIWSIGISGAGSGISYENFSDPREDKNLSLIDYFRSKSGGFADEQLGRGSFEELQSRINRSNVLSEKTLVSDAITRLNNNVILIQNANFENSKIGRVMDENNMDFSGAFRYKTLNSNSKKILYTPPKITSLRNQASYLRSNGAELEELLPIYENMLNEYNREFSNGDKNMVVELMDFSRAIFGKAANNGLINKKAFDGNLSVGFLSKEILGEEEVHTALSDSRQQEAIFFELLRMNDEFDKGAVSDKTKTIFSGINTKLKLAIREKFKKELGNITGEIERNGKTRLITSSLLKSIEVSVGGPNGIEKITVPKYREAIETSSNDEAMAHTIKRYSGLLDMESIKYEIENFTDNNTRLFPITHEMLNKKEKILNVGGKSRNVINTIIAGGVAVAGISYISGKFKEKNKENNKKKKEKIIREELFPIQDRQRHNYM